MKKTCILICLLTGSVLCRAQQKTLDIVCQVYFGEIKYEKLGKYLPDSLKTLLIHPKKTFSEELDLVNMLTLNGWKLVTATPDVRGSSGFGASTRTAYLLKKEITVSDAEFKAMLERMKKELK